MPTTIKLPCYGIVVTLLDRDPELPQAYVLAGASIASDLHAEVDPDDPADKQYDAALDALESIILGHAVAGVDITLPAYVEGIETAVEACANHL